MTKTTRVCLLDGRDAFRKAKIGDGYWCHACYEWSRKRSWADPSGRARHQTANPDRGCSVPECAQPHKGNGYCQLHYQQVSNHGRVTGLRMRRENGSMRQALLEATAGASDDCMFFEGRQTRHSVMFEGVVMQVSRAAWTARNGHPGPLHVLHACNGGSGDHGCINLRHLYLGTHAENMVDMVDMVEAGHTMLGRTDLIGEIQNGAIMTDAAVLEARSLWVKGSRFPNPGSTRALAARYGVSAYCMKDALTGRRWRRLLK